MKPIKATLLFLTLTISFGIGSVLSAQIWTQASSPDTNWTSIACSADGNKLAITGGGGYPGPIYISTNSGTTWVKSGAPDAHWDSIVSSSDGNSLAAVGWNAEIYISTNAGLTWISNNAPEVAWDCLACSSDGTKLAAAGFHPGVIYTSTNSGVSWTLTCTNHVIWRGLASSADGKVFIAVGSEYVYTSDISVAEVGGAIYISTNSGTSWIKSRAPEGEWNCVSTSADGTKFVVGGSAIQIMEGAVDPVNRVRGLSRGLFCVSIDSGKTWKTVRLGAPWNSVSASTDGTKMLATSFFGFIGISTNSGINWKYSRMPEKNGCRIASSANGGKTIVAFQNGSIYIFK